MLNIKLNELNSLLYYLIHPYSKLLNTFIGMKIENDYHKKFNYKINSKFISILLIKKIAFMIILILILLYYRIHDVNYLIFSCAFLYMGLELILCNKIFFAILRFVCLEQQKKDI